jgi:hypothetical protein
MVTTFCCERGKALHLAGDYDQAEEAFFQGLRLTFGDYGMA